MSTVEIELNVDIKEEDIASANGTIKGLESGIATKEEELVSIKKRIRVLEDDI